MSAAPSATLANAIRSRSRRWPWAQRSQIRADGRDHQRGRPRAGIHMADRALAEKRGAAAHRPSWHRRLGRSGGIAAIAWRQIRAACASAACTGASTSSMVFWPASDLPRALTASIAVAERARTSASVGCSRQLLAERQKQRAVERARGATDLHHQLRADRLQSVRQAAWRASASRSASTASKPRFMLMP